MVGVDDVWEAQQCLGQVQRADVDDIAEYGILVGQHNEAVAGSRRWDVGQQVSVVGEHEHADQDRAGSDDLRPGRTGKVVVVVVVSVERDENDSTRRRHLAR